MRIEVLERMSRMVEKRQVIDQMGRVGYQIVDSVFGSVAGGVVSERYTIVQNRDLISPFVSTFGADAFESAAVKRNGASLFLVRTGREFDIGGGDIIKERIAITNSYNKSRAFSFIFGAFRLVCSNGLFTGQAVINYKKIHVGEIPVSRIVSDVISSYRDNTFETWKRLRSISMTLVQQIEFAKTFKAFEEKPNPNDPTAMTASAYANKHIASRTQFRLGYPESLDNQRNAWGLLNAINRAISYVVPRSNFNRVILANRRAEEALVKAYLN